MVFSPIWVGYAVIFLGAFAVGAMKAVQDRRG